LVGLLFLVISSSKQERYISKMEMFILASGKTIR